MNNINIRKAKEEDLPYIISLLADDELGFLRENRHDQSAYLETFKLISEDPNQELMVAINEDDVMGTFQLSFIPYLTYQGGIRAQIEAVRIHKNFRGQGLGKMMLEWAIERAKQQAAHLVQLTTDKQRPDAIRFYEALGFKASHEGMKLHLRH
ncbi:GNAT family N-acetyltransferase [Marivirga arenosa]|uniref:GNAT family N-acetyltransferase n=1 Tax=Marivirga arenosa TaxID=3059076 RepID=A0AA51X3Q7_9BACT|nr:GNAT family N-acetyltransferase [Marivirga sp. BKB1-2]WNB16907.1 GNAT family N-acetyltransferase [Marivirga sp. BKB1-2]